MLFPNGRAVDDALGTISRGESRCRKVLRAELADRFGADITCPVTTRKCVQVVVDTAHEAAQNGSPIDDMTPFWRVADWSGPMLKKLSFNLTFIAEKCERERI